MLPEIGPVDGEQVQEQVKTVMRRMQDIKKRMERKKQLVEMAQVNFHNLETIQKLRMGFQSINVKI